MRYAIHRDPMQSGAERRANCSDHLSTSRASKTVLSLANIPLAYSSGLTPSRVLKAMIKTSRVAASPTPKRTAKPASKRTATPALKRSKPSATNVAIATELAPAVAIALLDKTEQPPGAPAPALDVLAAAAAPSEIDGNVRIQLMFENGAVLPVEMSVDAGAALSKGLEEELPKS
jgi:hypothetical protein